MDNDNGLYLPLRIDLTDWEKDLMTADSDLQKTMREMRSQVGNFKIKYDVEIANARAAGDNARALELENKKLNAVYEAQKRVVQQLNEAYKKSVQEKGADAKATQAVANALIRESKAMERTKAQLDATGLNMGKRLSDSLASVSPMFANVRQVTASVSSSLGSLGSGAATAATAVGGIGIAVAGLAAGASVLNKITDSVSEIGDAAAKANDPVYQLREQLETTYENAEKLQGVLNIDGVGVEQYSTALNKLNKQLINAGENGNTASDMLKRWHVEMRNGDGTRKDAIAQLQELAAGYKRAQKMGEGQDFLTATGTTSLVHVLNDLDGYIAKWQAIRVEYQRNYQLSHDLVESESRLAVARQQTAAVKGDIYLQSSYDILQKKIDAEVLEAKIIKGNQEAYENYGKSLAEVSNQWTELKLQASVALDKALMDIMTGINTLKEFKNQLGQVADTFSTMLKNSKIPDLIPESVKTGLKDIWDMQPGVKFFNWLSEKWTAAGNDVEKYRNEVDKAKDVKTDTKISETGKEKPVDVEAEKAAKKAQDERIKAYEKFNRELRDINSTEYEREINAINEKRDAYIKAGIDEVDADRMYTAQKEAIDRKYYEANKNEREKQAQAAEQAYQREVEAAKRAREASISEAESTLRTNLKLVRYIQSQKAQGTYNEANAKDYANQLYLKQSGFKLSDIAGLKDIGVNVVKDIANARERLFGQFANVQAPQATANNVTNNNTVNVNFDNTVLDNVAAMDLLANKVAAIIQPAIERAVANNERSGAYGY